MKRNSFSYECCCFKVIVYVYEKGYALKQITLRRETGRREHDSENYEKRHALNITIIGL